ncbi:MAG TPA: hypothetical protein ACFYD6_09690 [Candidatus Brocadiia bacterium]
MELNGFLQVFLGGMLGPVLVEFVKLAAWRDGAKIAEKYCQWSYWIATVALLFVSGIVVVINGVDHVTLKKAVQLGINAPTIVAVYANASVARRQRKANRAAFMGIAAEPTNDRKGFLQRTTELLAW